MKILKIKQHDINNGDGVRCSIWVSGCAHKCKGCWSKETWNDKLGKDYISIKGDVIKSATSNEVRGVSILGGDPLYHLIEKNDKDILDLLSELKNRNINIWLWTGYSFEEIPDTIKNKCDTIIEGKFMLEKRDIKLMYRGSSNQRVFQKNNKDIFIQIY